MSTLQSAENVVCCREAKILLFSSSGSETFAALGYHDDFGLPDSFTRNLIDAMLEQILSSSFPRRGSQLRELAYSFEQVG
jgi:hypothetical protein